MKLIQKIAEVVRYADVPKWWLGLVVGLLLPVSAFCVPANYEQTARQILDVAGVQGGLIVHLSCGDGRLTAALHANKSCIVQGLDADVTAARHTIRSFGLYGKVSAEPLMGNRLPYVDNLVNLVVADDLGSLPMEEVLRVLASNGVALVGDVLFVADTPVAFPEDDLAKAYEGRMGGVLWVASAATGEKLAENKLDAAPVWDSMAAAGGRLYIATQDSKLRCFGEKQ